MIKVYTVREARASILKRRDFPASNEKVNQMVRPEDIVRKIVEDVKIRGDTAIREWSLKLDHVDLEKFELKNIDFEGALTSIDPRLKGALEVAADRINRFHESQPIISWMNLDLGGQLGQIIRPIGRVGIYVPGGTVPLCSSLLMTAIPARVAGTKDLIVATPPRNDRPLSNAFLATCGVIKKLGINLRIFTIGGAQAIAAMAYGTKQVPKVDKIVGPGNRYVNLAKKEVYGAVGIDGIYGPTEAVIIADQSANSILIAADLIAQAEHDALAIPIVITSSKNLIDSIKKECMRQVNDLERGAIVQEAIEKNGGIILAQSTTQAIEFSNDFAPEHLTLMVKDPLAYLVKIENAGGIFIGESSFEVLGDYVAGPSHVMPTGGTARYSSALSVIDFVKRISYVNLNREKAKELASYAEIIARAEKLDGHANAAKLRKISNLNDDFEGSL